MGDCAERLPVRCQISYHLSIEDPIPLSPDDLMKSDLTIAVKETEHRPLMRRKFPDWEHKVVYWEVHDLDVEPANKALPLLRVHVESLFQELQRGDKK